MTECLWTLSEIKAKNHAVGQHYFEPDTMRFFRSRCSEQVFPCFAARVTYFVTSEQNRGWGGDFPRLYSVRKADWETGSCDTVGTFQGYKSLSGALGAARRLVKQSVAYAAPGTATSPSVPL